MVMISANRRSAARSITSIWMPIIIEPIRPTIVVYSDTRMPSPMFWISRSSP